MIATGARDPAVLNKLSALGMTSDTLLPLGLVPFVAMAWANSALDDRERSAIIANLGIERHIPAAAPL